MFTAAMYLSAESELLLEILALESSVVCFFPCSKHTLTLCLLWVCENVCDIKSESLFGSANLIVSSDDTLMNNLCLLSVRD